MANSDSDNTSAKIPDTADGNGIPPARAQYYKNLARQEKEEVKAALDSESGEINLAPPPSWALTILEWLGPFLLLIAALNVTPSERYIAATVCLWLVGSLALLVACRLARCLFGSLFGIINLLEHIRRKLK